MLTIQNNKEAKQNQSLLVFLFSLFIFSGFASSLKLSIGAININLSHVLCLFLLSYILIKSIIQKKIIFFNDSFSISLYLFFFTNFLSSILFAKNAGIGIKGSILIFSFILIYSITRNFTHHLFGVSEILSKLFLCNNLSVILGISSMVFSFLTGYSEIFGVSYDHIATSGIENLQSKVPSIRSLSIEPNLFASITSVILCLQLVIQFSDKRNNLGYLFIGFSVMSIVFAYTRSVYISFFLVLIIMLYLTGKLTPKILFLYIPVICFFCLILYFILPKQNSVISVFFARLTSIADFEGGSGLGRVQGYIIGISGFLDSPIFGNGTFSADTLFYNPYTDDYEHFMTTQGWLTGAWIQALHDTGIVGLSVVIYLFVKILKENYELVKRKGIDKYHRNIGIGFFCANIIIFISSQLSSILWITFPYIFWGLNKELLNKINKYYHT